MRVPRPLHYRQITEAIRPGTCPLCVVLRDFQASCIRESDLQPIEALCNYHTWALAGAAPAQPAASLFLRMLEAASPGARAPYEKACDICRQLREEESRRLDEFVEQLSHDKLRAWMNLQGTVCLPHAARLLPRLSAIERGDLVRMLEKRVAELKQELERLVNDTHAREEKHEGVLGKVAEILAAQRSLE